VNSPPAFSRPSRAENGKALTDEGIWPNRDAGNRPMASCFLYKRREFITLLGGAAVASRGVRAAGRQGADDRNRAMAMADGVRFPSARHVRCNSLLDRAEDRPARRHPGTGSPDNLDQATMLGEAPLVTVAHVGKNQPHTP